MKLKRISEKEARDLWYRGMLEVYGFYNDGSEALILESSDFDDFTVFGIERKPNFATNLKDLVDSIKVCDICSKLINYSVNFSNAVIEVYNSPFDKSGEDWIVCSKCYHEGYFNEQVEYCDSCDRHIRLSNGYRQYLRYDENARENVCVKCLQDKWFEDGMDNFKDADFFNYSDLEKHGFLECNSFFCQSEESYDNAEKVFKELQDKGEMVIVNTVSSGMGLEHHLSLHVKRNENKEFVINDLITMKLENNKTNIYINGQLFNQCKFLLMNIPNTYDDTNETFEYKSIDELAGKYSKELETEMGRSEYKITPMEEFKAHCSNIQAWVENDYNPEILHSSLSIPILKDLAKKDIKVFHSLVYHLDCMWNEYKTKERREMLYTSFCILMKECMKQYKLKLYDISGSVFLSMLKFTEMTDLFVANVRRMKNPSYDYRKNRKKHSYSRFRQKGIKRAKRRNYYYRKKYFPNRQERDFVMSLWNQEVSPISDEIDYPIFLWFKRPQNWHRFIDKNEYYKKDAKIKQIYLDKGFEDYYYLDDSVYLVSGGYSSNSYSFHQCFIRKNDGSIIRDYILC